MLCDVIGQTGTDNQWKRECFRVVGDNEKPLMLQSLWKPKEGFSRRFEIQLRASVEEQSLKDRDTVTAGIHVGLCFHTFSFLQRPRVVPTVFKRHTSYFFSYSSVTPTSLRLVNQSLRLCCGGMGSLYPCLLLQANSLHCPAYHQLEQGRWRQVSEVRRKQKLQLGIEEVSAAPLLSSVRAH